MIFSVHGSEANCYDLPSMLFLPEFLARFSIPGQIMMSSSKAGTSVPPVISQPRRQNWRNEIWEEHRYEPNALKRLLRSLLPRTFHKPLDRMFGAARGTRLVSPQQLKRRGQAPGGQPTMWYNDLWPEMKAFALPTY